MEWKLFPNEFKCFYSELDPTNIYRTQLKGGYSGELENTKGEKLAYAVYYPENLEFSGRSIIIALPENMSCDAFLETTLWRNISDSLGILLFLVCGPTSAEDIAAAVKEHRNRKYMDTKTATTYIVAYGNSARGAYGFVISHPEEFAGAAFAGNVVSAHEALNTETLACFKNTEIPVSSIPLHIMFTGEQDWDSFAPVLDYWKRANVSEREPYFQGKVEIYLPDEKKTVSRIEHIPCARVELIKNAEVLDPCMTETIWRFVSMNVRGPGINWGDLNPYRTAQELGYTRHELVIDAYTRVWYEYLPQRQQVLTDGKLPLVVYCHGGSANPLTDASVHLWSAAAAERGFAVVLPIGTVRNMDNMMPHMAWNAANLSDHMNDEKFIRAMIDDICTREPIDRGRIYANGHSMGSAMTQRLALAMPDVFAAAAGNSGVTKGGFMGDFDTPGVREDMLIPLWVQMGENDIGGGTLENNPDAARAMLFWSRRYGIEDGGSPNEWRSGRYLNREWVTKKGIPLLRYTTTMEKPHSITPQDPFLYYDEFFCHYRRDEDGTLYYNGKAVEL